MNFNLFLPVLLADKDYMNLLFSSARPKNQLGRLRAKPSLDGLSIPLGPSETFKAGSGEKIKSLSSHKMSGDAMLLA